MDISSAGTEQLYRIVKFHNSVNRLIKTIAASLTVTAHALGDGPDAAKKLALLIQQTGEPWGTYNHFPPQLELEKATTFLSEMGIALVDSAFDDFVTSTEGEISRWLASQGQQTPKKKQTPLSEANDEEEKLEHLDVVKLCTSHGWNWESSKNLLLVFQFFHRIRNCVAHRSGRVTKGVEEQSRDEGFLKVWKKTARGRRNAPIELPHLSGSKILVLPRHVILYSHICFKLAQFVSNFFVQDLGENGVVYLAAYHSLLRDDPLPWGDNPKRPESAVNWILMERFRVKQVSGPKTIKALRDLKIWDLCFARFKALSERK